MFCSYYSVICFTQNGENGNKSGPDFELSFEYLVAKDKLMWITISSEQAILMSICLQSMVDELLLKKNGIKRKMVRLHFICL